jgi:hypothetical protein
MSICLFYLNMLAYFLHVLKLTKHQIVLVYCFVNQTWVLFNAYNVLFFSDQGHSFKPCNDGFVADRKNGHCYKLLDKKYISEDGHNQCTAMKADVLQFYSEAQLKGFMTLITTGRSKLFIIK